jgi:hypothetical protein
VARQTLRTIRFAKIAIRNEMKFKTGDTIVPSGNVFPDGALEVLRIEKAKGIVMIEVVVMGGGFIRRIPLEFFKNYEVVPESDKELLFRRGKFQIDDSTIFDGWTCDGVWNGWACPSFEYDVAVKILTEFKCKFTFDPIKRIFTVEYFEEDDFPYKWGEFDIDDPSGNKVSLYGIGCYEWIWDEVKENNNEQQQQSEDPGKRM